MNVKKRNRKEFGMAALVDQPEQFKPGRRCRLCRKVLSIYNPGPTCLSYCGKEKLKENWE